MDTDAADPNDVPAADAKTPEPASAGTHRPGSVVWGIVLLAVGLGWLLESLGVVDLAWETVLPAALALTGVVVVVQGARGRPVGSMVVLGLILLVLTLGTRAFGGVDVSQTRAFGEFEHAPDSVEELEDGYGVVMGSLILDLREIDADDFENLDPIDINVVMGQGTVRLPEDVAVRVDGRVVMGDANVLGDGRSGLVRGDEIESDDWDANPDGRLELTPSVTMGSLVVER